MDTARAETSVAATPIDDAPTRRGFGPALPFLQTLVAGFAASRHRIHIVCEPDLQLPVAELDAVGAILNEAISNALWHAFPEGRDGDIWVRLSEAGGRVTLAIRDNGIGMPDLDHAPNSGRGRIETVAQQLGGRSRMGSVPFGGAEVQVVFQHNH